MIKAIIDTNCLIASIPPKNPEFWLYKAFRNIEFEWLISNEILTEYEEQLSHFYSPKTASLVIQILLASPNVTLAEPFYRWNLITNDPDDNKFADLAISCNAHYLVSNDRHFKVLKLLDFPLVNVVDLKMFQQILGY